MASTLPSALGHGQAGRPRVLMVCARFFPDMGGIETHVHEVARRISASGEFDVTILTTDRTRRLPPRDSIDGVDVLRVPAWPRRRDYYFAPQIARIVGRRDHWDLVHCQGIHTPVPMLAMLAARRSRTPYVATFHTGGSSLRHRNALRSVQWRAIGGLLRNAVSLVAVSGFEAELIARQAHLGAKPVTVVRNGGTLPPPPPGTAVVPGRILSPGRLERYKGHHRVIEALPYVLSEIPTAHVSVLGSGPYEQQLRDLADRLGVADRVSITSLDPADRAGMAAALGQASIIAAMSQYEAHPVAVMEGLGAGRPVVGADTAGISDLVAEGWVRGVPADATASSLGQILVAAMSEPARVNPDDLPTWDSCADRLADLYRRALPHVATGSDHSHGQVRH
jgi:glycosyltransferase involved in cell wall biosynthesis